MLTTFLPARIVSVLCLSSFRRLSSALGPGTTLLAALLLSVPVTMADPPAAAPEDAVEPAAAEDAEPDREKKAKPSLYYELTVTATRTEKDLFDVPNPVSVVSGQRIGERALGTVTHHLRELVGLDVNGVGANQPRPVIRGQRGQRVLLLKDGLRMNNFRRQSSFGELPALFDIGFVDRVEVVRGPGSVLYGSDAIGGVVNIISRQPDLEIERGELHGRLGYRFDSAGRAGKAYAGVEGRLGRASWSLEGNYRDAEDYDAPAGSYGDITLAEDTRVFDTGVRDKSVRLGFQYPFDERHVGSLEIETYRARDAGFGFVDPAAYAPGEPRIRILYPDQKFNQITFGHRASDLDSVLAHRVRTSLWVRSNERDLVFDLFIPFGPGMGLQIDTQNFTDLDSVGLRSEATKALGPNHALTYGIDYLRDDSFNTDRNVTTMIGAGPPIPDVDDTPTTPNASYESVGVFVQDDMKLTDRVALIVGARYQRAEAQTRGTEGLEDEPFFDGTDHAVVGAANLIVTATDNLKLVANLGRAFRSPNLIERFFNGPTPEGIGFQSRNPALNPETSFNVDLGLKYRRQNVYFETFLFHNTIRDGIRIAPTGGMVGPFPEFMNVNIDKLRYEGIETVFDASFRSGMSFGINFTHILTEDVLDENNPVTDGYSDKLVGRVRYTHPDQLFFVEYNLTHNGEQDDLVDTMTPVGDRYPSFTVHGVLAGVKLYERRGISHTLGIEAENLTDELYAQFTNVGFFRPEPGRSIRLDWRLGF